MNNTVLAMHLCTYCRRKTLTDKKRFSLTFVPLLQQPYVRANFFMATVIVFINQF